MEPRPLEDLMVALGVPMRIRVLRLLASESAGLPAGEIANRLGLANSSLSKHMRELCAADLVTAKRQWRTIVYLANPARLDALRGMIAEELMPPPG
jgi:DNA-binding transcriptional ArsR family regulator